MYCTECGSQNSDQAAQCVQCSNILRQAPLTRSASIEDHAGMRMLLPIGRSWWALVAGYLGLVSILLLPAPFALFCGIMGIIDIRKNSEKHGMGRCVFAVIVGGLFSALLMLFIVCAIIG